MRKSVAMLRSKSGHSSRFNVGVNSSSSQNVLKSTLKKRSSFRKSVDVSLYSKSDANFSNSASSLTVVKTARVVRYTYSPDTEIENVAKTFDVEVFTPPPSGKGTLRKSLMINKRVAALLTIGDGKIKFTLANGKTIAFEVGALNSFELRKSKAFLITIDQSDASNETTSLTVFTKDAEETISIARSLFVEARAMTAVFETVLSQLLPADWKNVLQSDSNSLSTINSPVFSTTSAQAAQTIKLSKLDSVDKQKIEVCLREVLDLVTLAKGEHHMDTFENQQKLAKWLELNGKVEEASFWNTVSEENLKNYDKKRNVRANDGNNEKIEKESYNVIEELRNPKSLEKMMEMKNDSVPKNLELKVKQVLEKLDDIVKKSTKSKSDHFEEMI